MLATHLPVVEMDHSDSLAKDTQRDRINVLIVRWRECGLKTRVESLAFVLLSWDGCGL